MLFIRQLRGRLAASSLIFHQARCRTIGASCRNYSNEKTTKSQNLTDELLKPSDKSTEHPKPKKKTQAELDQELLLKMQDHDGDGGVAGVEYEDGKPVSMKRSVKNNMFRYI
ncbi:hypothetical protein ACN47E_005438 [Coniothyrium glycines]